MNRIIKRLIIKAAEDSPEIKVLKDVLKNTS